MSVFERFLNNIDLTFGDKLFGGLMILIIGMVTVFAVLALIWLLLILFKLAFHDLPAKRKAQQVVTDVVEQSPIAVASNNDEEIVAVIAAAIAMAESESDGVKFRVVSFRRR